MKTEVKELSYEDLRLLTNTIDTKNKATEITLGVDKTVSVAAVQDRNVRDAFQVAVKQTAESILQTATTKYQGQRVQAPQAFYSAQTHMTNRAGEPHLHTHVTIANLTVVNGEQRAIDIHALFDKNQHTKFTNMLQINLQKELQSRGIKAELEQNGKYVAAVIPQLKEAAKEFSQRQEQIKNSNSKYFKAEHTRQAKNIDAKKIAMQVYKVTAEKMQQKQQNPNNQKSQEGHITLNEKEFSELLEKSKIDINNKQIHANAVTATRDAKDNQSFVAEVKNGKPESIRTVERLDGKTHISTATKIEKIMQYKDAISKGLKEGFGLVKIAGTAVLAAALQSKSKKVANGFFSVTVTRTYSNPILGQKSMNRIVMDKWTGRFVQNSYYLNSKTGYLTATKAVGYGNVAKEKNKVSIDIKAVKDLLGKSAYKQALKWAKSGNIKKLEGLKKNLEQQKQFIKTAEQAMYAVSRSR